MNKKTKSHTKKCLLWFCLLLLTSHFLLLTVVYAQPLAPATEGNGIKFFYEAPDAGDVCLAGEFNGWASDKEHMTKDENGVWSIVYPLKEGKYEYKFVVDGAWMEGANLVVTIKKNKSGELFVEKEKEKEGTATPYSSQIRFGGKVVGLLYTYYDRNRRIWRTDVDSSTAHVDIDWYAKPFEEASCFMRMEMESRNERYRLKFKQGDFSFTPKDMGTMNLTAYYNKKFIQFDDPLKILDENVSLRYDSVDFYDEFNPHKAYGFGTQGVFQTAGIYGFDEKFFYSNLADTGEDTLGFRIKKPFDRITFGISYVTGRGVPWVHAQYGTWFPDPEEAEGRSYNVNITTQPWYEGFVYRKNFGLDFAFKMHDKVTLFSEYAAGDEKLVAKNWNESIGTNVPIDKDWLIKEIDDIIVGLKYNMHNGFAAELSYENKKQNLGNEIYSGYEAKTNTVKGTAKYAQKPYAFGILISRQNSAELEGAVFADEDLHPYYEKTLYVNYVSSIPVAAATPETDFLVMPYVSFDTKDIKIRVLSKINSYQYRGISESSGTYSISPLTDLSDLDKFETILEHSIRIVKSVYFEGSTRFMKLEYKDESKLYIAEFLALTLRFKKNAYIKLGWGVDPEGFDEDIYEDVDKREEFLHDKYLETNSVHEAESLLQLEQRISLRTEIRF